MKIGRPGDSLSLPRVLAAMVLGGVVLGAVGYLFDLLAGPLIGMSGWWTVFGSGGIILGGMLQAVREFAVPSPEEQEELREEAAAREAAVAAHETEAAEALAETPVSSDAAAPERPAEP